MRKLIISFLAAIMVLGSESAYAGDVTGNHLVNADFSAGPVTTTSVHTYHKDVGLSGVSSLQEVSGWNYAILNEAPDTGSSGDGMAGAVMAYGSTNGFNMTTVPATGPNGNAGNCLGFVAVWTCGGYYYQNVTLPIGRHTITIPVYNGSGSEPYTSYIGFLADDGTNYVATDIPSVGQWTTLTVSFELTEQKSGRLALGYKAADKGSAVAPHLFFDCVHILSDRWEWIDCTDYLQNPGFDEDISFNDDGSAAKPVTLAYEWSASSSEEWVYKALVYKATDGSIYSKDNGGTQGVNAAGDPNWDGFKVNIKGWETTNKSDTAIWIYYGVVPYSLGDGMMMLGSGENGMGNQPEKPIAINTDENTGVLFLKAGWQNSCSYKQTVKGLATAKYRLSYYIRNTNVDKSRLYEAATNLCNVTCNGMTFTDNEGFNSEGWVRHVIDFIPVDSFSVEFGCQASNNYSYNNPILWVDGIELHKMSEVTDEEVDATYGELAVKADSLVAVMHFAADRQALQEAINSFATDKGYVELYQAITKAETSETKYREITADDAILTVVTDSLQADGLAYGNATDIVSYACTETTDWMSTDRASYSDADSYMEWLDAYANYYAPAYNKAGAFVDSIGSKRAKCVLEKMQNQSFMLTNGAMATAKVVKDYAEELGWAMAAVDYDINSDGAVDIGDIVMIVGIMVGTMTDEETLMIADVNKDNAVDIGDIVAVIDFMTSQPTTVHEGIIDLGDNSIIE